MESLALATGLAARRDDASRLGRAARGARGGVTRMSLADALDLGAIRWDAVMTAAATTSPFMSWAWHRAWADSAPADQVAASEALVLYDRGGVVQALLPLTIGRLPFHRIPVMTLTWATGDLGCPDHLDLLALPEADLGALAAALDALPWQVIVLSNLAPNAAAARRLCEALAGYGHTLRRRPLWACPDLELCDDWERYLASLTPTRRQTVRRKERNLRRDHTVTFTDYGGDRLEEGWGHLTRLHARRWEGAGGGAFQTPGAEALQRRFAGELESRRQLWLTTLDLDGEPAAAWYGFAWHDTVYFYQGGRDPRWDRESVGLVLMGAMIRRAIERGYRRFDFLRGEDPYKRQWTATERVTEEITIVRRGWRGHWLRALDAAADWRTRLRGGSARAQQGEADD